jgi:hypothetical protein
VTSLVGVTRGFEDRESSVGDAGSAAPISSEAAERARHRLQSSKLSHRRLGPRLRPPSNSRLNSNTLRLLSRSSTLLCRAIEP